MLQRTRRDASSARAPAAPLAILAALAIAAWAFPAGLRAQQTTQPTTPQAGPQQPPGPGVTVPPAAEDAIRQLVKSQQPQAQSGAAGQPGPAPGSGPGGPPGALPPGVEQPPQIIGDGPQLPAMPRTPITIDPKTPVKDLLPIPPKSKTPAHRGPAGDMASVPELDFQAPLAKGGSPDDAAQRTARMLAGINFLNGKKQDGFLSALRGDRADLDGLPFAMGDACRTRGERNRQFTAAVATVRQALQSTPLKDAPDVQGQGGGEAVRADTFWQQFRAICDQQDQGASHIDRPHQEAVALARVAALMQILAPENPDFRMGLVKYLSGVPYADATRALAKLAIFSPEDEIRRAAVDALQVRRERDYTDMLLTGLRYPWPAVARRSADAVAKLGRNDLTPQLVALLDEPDPRAPATRAIDDKPALTVRELVRVNHHRNCLMCHSPGDTEGISQDTLKAPILLPTEQLSSPVNGYQSSRPDLLARIDVTYLRQDFSLMMPVEDANPWPEMQRFDFLVRTRAVTDDEAKEYREKLDGHDAGRQSPYHAAVLSALRELTGKDAAPTAQAWRRVLDLPNQQ